MLLYIHIPFCDSKCYYCSFNSYVDKFHLKDKIVKAMIKQFEEEIERFNIENKSIETLYIGGGTPSTLEISDYKTLFNEIKPYLKENIQISIEANPNSATKEWLEGIYNLGVNRISFGVQSFNDRKLKFLGRNHNSKVAKERIKLASEIGFKNISIDLIYGTALDDKRLLFNELLEVDKLNINHISLYSLTLEENTKFYNREEKKNDNEENAKYFIKEIEKRGFFRYEASNFGKNYISQHNLGYWQYKNYIGIGSGAVGFLKDKRFYTEKNLENYIKNPLFREIENLSKEEIKIEKLFIGLRSIVGVEESILNKKERKRVTILEENGKILRREGKIYNKEFFLSDEIALFILS